MAALADEDDFDWPNKPPMMEDFSMRVFRDLRLYAVPMDKRKSGRLFASFGHNVFRSMSAIWIGLLW